MNKQIHLEALRGLASAIVVVAHYAAAFYPSSIFGSKCQSHEQWEKMFATTPLGLVFAGHFAVCLFFVLSGYVLSLPYFGQASRDTNHLLAAFFKRPFRLGGLVLASILISILLSYFSFYFNISVSKESYSIPWFQDLWTENLINAKQILVDLTTRIFANGSKYNPPLWTLQLELDGSLLTFIFLMLFRRSNLRVLVYIYAIIYFHGSLYHGFIFGIILADFTQNYSNALKIFSRGVIPWILLTLGLLFSSYPNYVDQSDLTNTFYGVLPHLRGLGGGYSMFGAVIVFTAVLINPRLQKMLSGKGFVFLGRISYAMYVIHFLLLGSFSSWLFINLHFRLSYNLSFAIAATLSFGILIFVSYVLTKYIDEPVTRLSNSLAKKYMRSISEKISLTMVEVGIK
jgi:peptidoglycan/LPS O-acetylase OafA/YrhL